MDVIIFTDDNRFAGFARYAGAYRIASELRSHGFSVQVIDFFSRYSIEELKQILKNYVSQDTLFLGFATSLWVRNFDYREYLANSYEAHLKTLFPHENDVMEQFFNWAKEINPNIRFVVGGSKAEGLEHSRVDHWVIGQGETAVLDLAQSLKKNPHTFFPKIIEGNKLPYQDFTKSQISWAPNDYIFPKECLPIEIARGCIFRCSFCYYPLNGKKKNEFVKTEDVLFEEIMSAHERFGTETFLFTDDLINDSLEKMQMLHSLAKRLPFKLEWSGFCRLDLIYSYPKMIELILESGARSVYFGIETFHKSAGLRSGKGLGEEKIKDTLAKIKSAWKNEVLINAGFIVGLPGEPKESILKTFEWLHQDDCPIDVADIGVLNIKARDNLKGVAIFNSRIGQDPNAFGIKVSPTYWEHETMNSDEAFKLVDQYYADPRFLKKKRGAPLTVYPRLKNLGFPYSDISRVSWGNIKFIEEAERRGTNLFNIYKEKIFSHSYADLIKKKSPELISPGISF